MSYLEFYGQRVCLMLLEFHDLYYKTFQKIGTLVEVKSNNNKITSISKNCLHTYSMRTTLHGLSHVIYCFHLTDEVK